MEEHGRGVGPPHWLRTSVGSTLLLGTTEIEYKSQTAALCCRGQEGTLYLGSVFTASHAEKPSWRGGGNDGESLDLIEGAVSMVCLHLIVT